MMRRWVWLQLLMGWVPVWALFLALVLTGHPGISVLEASWLALRLILAGALLGLLVHRLTLRLPWPHPMHVGFVALHLVGAAAYAALWLVLNNVIESILHGRLVFGFGPQIGYLVLGVWLYVMTAGVSYAAQASERASRIEADAARAQLAALRAQLNPHFLFNALHTVVQLIPREPQRAAEAAELVAGLLRTTIEEHRDLVSVSEEWAFVERYLDVERIRFGDRLRLQLELTDTARTAQLPSFALQTLVENAVRHGAAPRVEPTVITVTARVDGDVLALTVQDDGAGGRESSGEPAQAEPGDGTGLRRLRDRLAALYGTRARLDVGPRPGGGFIATLRVPQLPD